MAAKRKVNQFSDYGVKVTESPEGDIQHLNIDNFPAGTATEAAQEAANTRLSSIDTKLDSLAVSVSNLPTTQPVSAASLPLPAGAAQEATQAQVQVLLDAIRRLLTTIAQPGWVDPALNRVRETAIVESGTVTTVTTVTGVTNVDGYQGKILMIGQDMAAWAACVRARIG